MRLGLRLLFAFFFIVGLAGFFALQVFRDEINPSVREVMEDVLVDTAHLVAVQATDELRAMPPGGDLRGSHLARALALYRQRAVDVQIWGLRKRSLDFRIYVTDAKGRVVLDSGSGGEDAATAIGADYSHWRDVGRTLRGEYGARSTPDVQGDDRSAVMYVAAPVQDGGRVIGVVTVAKPVSTVQQFIDRARRRIFDSGLLLLASAALVGAAVTGWMVTSVRKLKRYAIEVQAGERRTVPSLPGELGDLARAVDDMRARLEERERLEHTVRALTHELKSPLAAIRGAAEFLHDDLPLADREQFARQVQEQTDRMRELVDRLLALSRLEGRRSIEHPEPVPLLKLIDAVAGDYTALAAQRGIRIDWEARESLCVEGDPQSLELLFSNLWSNALDFGPDRCPLACALRREGDEAVFVLRDRGPGVSDFALPQLGRRFFSLPRPRDGRRGSGLGLAIVRQAVALHSGSVRFELAQPGLRAVVRLPLS